MTDVLDAILLQDGLLLATLSMDKRSCGYLGCISGWLGALRGSPGSQIVDLGCRDTECVRGNDKNILDVIVLEDDIIPATMSMNKGNWLT